MRDEDEIQEVHEVEDEDGGSEDVLPDEDMNVIDLDFIDWIQPEDTLNFILFCVLMNCDELMIFWIIHVSGILFYINLEWNMY